MCIYMLKIRYSRHARLRMVERGISENEVEQAILKGNKRIKENAIISAHLYFEVVYRKIMDVVYVITVQLRW